VLRIRDVYPGSRILIFIYLDPGSSIPDPQSRIPDPTTVTKEEGEKFVLPCFVATNITKLEKNFIFEQVDTDKI
jgi:hypothetical protein